MGGCGGAVGYSFNPTPILTFPLKGKEKKLDALGRLTFYPLLWMSSDSSFEVQIK